jgi:hypothetical protein
VRLPKTALRFLDWNEPADRKIELSDRLGPSNTTKIRSTILEALGAGIPISEIPPLTPLYLELN